MIEALKNTKYNNLNKTQKLSVAKHFPDSLKKQHIKAEEQVRSLLITLATHELSFYEVHYLMNTLLFLLENEKNDVSIITALITQLKRHKEISLNDCEIKEVAEGISKDMYSYTIEYLKDGKSDFTHLSE